MEQWPILGAGTAWAGQQTSQLTPYCRSGRWSRLCSLGKGRNCNKSFKMTDEFWEEKFMKILSNLKGNKESIKKFAEWCLTKRKSAHQMASCWNKVIPNVQLEQKLVLFYLVNEIIQHSTFCGYKVMIDNFRGVIKESMPHFKDEKIRPKVQRCLDIWKERDVFSAEYIQELASLIALNPVISVKKDLEFVENSSPIKPCRKKLKLTEDLENKTNYKLGLSDLSDCLYYPDKSGKVERYEECPACHTYYPANDKDRQAHFFHHQNVMIELLIPRTCYVFDIGDVITHFILLGLPQGEILKYINDSNSVKFPHFKTAMKCKHCKQIHFANGMDHIEKVEKYHIRNCQINELRKIHSPCIFFCRKCLVNGSKEDMRNHDQLQSDCWLRTGIFYSLIAAKMTNGVKTESEHLEDIQRETVKREGFINKVISKNEREEALMERIDCKKEDKRR